VKRSSGGYDFVSMIRCYHNSDNGEALFLNTTDQVAGQSFWYEIYPHILMNALVHCYPEDSELGDLMESTARRWLWAVTELKGTDGVPNFDCVAFDFHSGQAVQNGKWREPDAAAGVAWLMYANFARTRDQRYLMAAQDAMQFLENIDYNPFYEVLLPFGAYVAARMNAEQGLSFDVQKLVNWCFDGDSRARPGWGVIAERWGDYDCHGLVGSLTDWGQRWDLLHENASMEVKEDISGYAFAANTFAVAAPLVPLVRYDSRFAHDIGKWMGNVAVSARLFYPGELSTKHESCAFFHSDPKRVIAYEGLRKKWDQMSPYATGDAIRYSWGSIDLGLYGSSHVGIFGGIVSQTNVPGILMLDCLKTDFFCDKAYPTYLLYNPHGEQHTVLLDVGDDEVQLYDATAHSFGASGSGMIPWVLQPDSAALLIWVPAGSELKDDGTRRMAGDVVIDYCLAKN